MESNSNVENPSPKSKTEIFIEKARKVHGDKYDYSKVNYVKVREKVCIICPEHGEFWQRVDSHLSGNGCPKCMNIKSSKDDFIKNAIKIHKDKYDYSKSIYRGRMNKLLILCPEHGEFWQSPYNHLKGCGCPKCQRNYKSNTEEFIKKSKEIYGDRFDYSNVDYVNNSTKVCIICPEHGEFWQTPANHLRGHNCPKCNGGVQSCKDEFIKKAKEVHGDKYDYSKVEYINNNTKVCIICPEHGEFWQLPGSHLSGEGCSKCSGHFVYGQDEFIERSRKVHRDKYDYSKVEYENARTEVCIICPEHGEFWQMPMNHLKGCGCPSCNSSKLEMEVHNLFPEMNQQKSFKWLIYRRPMRLDFYSPDLNIAIECQGEQHFRPVDVFGGEDEFKNLIERDFHKYQLCQSHNIKVLYYFLEEYTPTEFYSDKLCFHTLEDLKSYIDLLSL